MNTSPENIGSKPDIYLEHPVVGITSPEFLNFVEQMVKTIGRMTRNSAKTFINGIANGPRYLIRQWRKAAQIHNRAKNDLDRRYVSNFYHLRCFT